MRAASSACTEAGTASFVDRRDEPVAAAPALQMTGLDQRAHDLLGEERVAAGARVDRIREPLECSGPRRADRPAARGSPRARAARARSAGTCERCIHSARYSGRKLTSSRPCVPEIASTHSSSNASLAPSSQCRSSISSNPGRSARACWSSRRDTRRAGAGAPPASIRGTGRSGSATPRKSKSTGSTSRKPSSRSSRRPGDLLARAARRRRVRRCRSRRGTSRGSGSAGCSCRGRPRGPRARRSPRRGTTRGTRSRAGSCRCRPRATTPTTAPCPALRPRERGFERVHLVSRARRSARGRAHRDTSKPIARGAHARELGTRAAARRRPSRGTARGRRARRIPPRGRRSPAIRKHESASASDSIALREADGVALRGVVHAQVVADLADHHLAGVEPDARGEVEAVLAPHARAPNSRSRSSRCSAA